MSELKNKVARGVAWSVAEKTGTMLLQMGVSLTVLGLLLPEDFSVVAILTAFAAFATVVVDSGFSQTLIRKAEPSERDYLSVFLFNIVVAGLFYGGFVAAAPWVARYYAMPVLAEIAPVFFLILPINALAVIQNTRLTRQFRFALLSKVGFAASLISGAVAIGLAVAGYGVWALVWQRLLQIVVRTLMLWIWGDWRPRAGWSFAALKAMAPYSFSLMTTDLSAALFNKIPQLFIGKLYAPALLGYFDQALKLKDLPVTQGMMAVQGVTFPALSRLADDERKFAESYRQVVMVVAYLFFPMMLGLSAVAHDLFAALLNEKWMPTVPYFEAICLTGLTYPIAMIAYNILKVQSQGGLIVRLEVVKKSLLALIFVVTIPRSVEAVVWGLVLFSAIEMVVNVVAAARFTTLRLSRLARTLLPIALLAAAMYAAVYAVTAALPDNAWLRLGAGIVTGLAVYGLGSLICRLEAYRELLNLVRVQLHREA